MEGRRKKLTLRSVGKSWNWQPKYGMAGAKPLCHFGKVRAGGGKQGIKQCRDAIVLVVPKASRAVGRRSGRYLMWYTIRLNRNFREKTVGNIFPSKTPLEWPIFWAGDIATLDIETSSKCTHAVGSLGWTEYVLRQVADTSCFRWLLFHSISERPTQIKFNVITHSCPCQRNPEESRRDPTASPPQCKECPHCSILKLLTFWNFVTVSRYA